jgi:hypothetical protein
MDFLPEIPERDATGITREIYGELKRLGGVPMVALIFRHLATRPGGLEWAWGAIGPAMASGRLQEAAWRIAAQARPHPIATMPRAALAALGVDDAALRAIHGVADAYNRANPANLLSVSCLARVLQGANGAGFSVDPWRPPDPIAPLIAMIDVAAMPREVADLLDLVAASGTRGGPRLVPSLYRHFGHRPQFLALLVTLLLPRFEDGSIARSVASVREAMDAAADGLAGHLRAPPAPDAGIAVALERFGAMIPEMIVVGALLKRALPAA